jgi:hypothetical protein
VMMDGAAVNRTIVKGIQHMFGCYSAPNINIPGETITYIMDPKVLTVRFCTPIEGSTRTDNFY